MEIQLRLVVHWKKLIYDDLTLSPSGVARRVKMPVDEDSPAGSLRSSCEKAFAHTPKYLNDSRIDAYAVSAYVDTLKRSYFYRRCALRPLLRCIELIEAEHHVVLIRLRSPRKQFLDYKWARIITLMALERSEVDHAMSWLSTLGGAYSALGDHFQHCAQIAGKISLHQFNLAMKLGEPLLVARCKLYAALSIIQRGNLRIPRRMIQEIFKYAREQRDSQLQRMCKGVWAKLTYCYKMQRQQRTKQVKK